MTDHLLESIITGGGVDPEAADVARAFAAFVAQPGWQSRLLRISARQHRSPYDGFRGTSTTGKARLTRGDGWAPGEYFSMEGIDGYEFAQVTGAREIPVVNLQRRRGDRWETWMVDDPLHVRGTRALVDRIVAEAPRRTGEVLVAGLGMGLQLHAMARRGVQGRFRRVTVVEIDPDVVALVNPHLARLKRSSADTVALDFQIVRADFYDYLRRTDAARFDAVYWDLAVGTPAETRADFARGCAECDAHAPGVPLFQFGLRPDGAPRKYDVGAARL